MTIATLSTFAVIALVMIVTNISTISFFSNRNADRFASALTYLLQPTIDALDSQYLNDIDRPMEAELTSSPFISFAFATARYPTGEALITRLTNDLDALTLSASSIIGAFGYTAVTDTYLASTSLMDASSPFPDPPANLRDIIYGYNTGTLRKHSLPEGENLTFMFKYHDQLLISKDLTPKSGQASATLFLLLDMERFTDKILGNQTLGTFSGSVSVGIFDDQGSLLHASTNMNGELASEILRAAPGEADVLKMSDGYGMFFRSVILNWQYVFIVDHDFMSPFANPGYILLILGVNLAAASVLAVSMTFLLLRALRPINQSIGEISQLLSMPPDARHTNLRSFLRSTAQRIRENTDENAQLRSVVARLSPHAVSMILLQMLSSGDADMEALQVALKYSDQGFGIDDLYVAGVVCMTDPLPMDIKMRHQILLTINHILERQRERANFNFVTLTLDMPFYALVLSFPPSTSVAAGRQLVNELAPALTTALMQAGINVRTHFGHLYHSIHDLPFSYHEAMKALTPPDSAFNNVNVPAPLQAVSAAPETRAGESSAVLDYEVFIDNRASQITQLVIDGKRDAVEQVLERTFSTIAQERPETVQLECAQRLVNVVTEIITSQKFVVPEQLTDASRDLYELIRAGEPCQRILEAARAGVNALCDDFADILERQKNPYIIASMEYIDAHCTNPDLSLEEIAEALKIAPNYLSSLFSKTLGKKLFEYVNEVRLQKSIDLLLHSRYSVTEISEKSGFGSPRNYVRVFKKYMDTTPTAYRKQHVGSATAEEKEDK